MSRRRSSPSLSEPALDSAAAPLYAVLGCGTGRTNPVALTLAAHAGIAVRRVGGVRRVAMGPLGHAMANRGAACALLLAGHDAMAALRVRRAGDSLTVGRGTAPVKVVAGH